MSNRARVIAFIGGRNGPLKEFHTALAFHGAHIPVGSWYHDRFWDKWYYQTSSVAVQIKEEDVPKKIRAQVLLLGVS